MTTLSTTLWQPALPEKYFTMSDEVLAQSIAERKSQLDKDLILLGHHYQQDDVVQFADFTGDSFKLSQLAAQRVKETGAKYVVFLGVHFMAESADILTPDDTAVILPDLSAGCSMADMATYDETVHAWEIIHQTLARKTVPRPAGLAPNTYKVVPVCYMNSSAAIKAFCGQHGGCVCTSSNCDKVLAWALDQHPGYQVKVLFLPDQHLGRNTAAGMGYDPDKQMCLWDPRAATISPDGLGCQPQQIEQSTFILWKGHCSVHKLFRPEHIDALRTSNPNMQIIVHPECDIEVVRKADVSGSTEGILNTVLNSEPGSEWAVGTEVHMVNRLARQAAKKGIHVRMLSDCQCLCTTMYRIDMPHLLWILDNLIDGKIVNQITVHPEAKNLAKKSLNQMLELVGDGNMATID